MNATAPRMSDQPPADEDLDRMPAADLRVPALDLAAAGLGPDDFVVVASQGKRDLEALRAALATAVQRAEGAGIPVGQHLRNLPFFTARVDAAHLAKLAAMFGVADQGLEA